MPYTTNPHLPKLRMQAARLTLFERWSTRQVARYTGYNQSTIVRWVARAKMTNRRVIATRSSRPRHHPRELPEEVVSRILALRAERNQCAEILHHRLVREGIVVSLSSVKRILKRYGCTRFSPWKKWHTYPPRPLPAKPGILVQIDTVWTGSPDNRLYAYTLLDVCSRWGYAWATQKINTFKSIWFLEQARSTAPFAFLTLQSDHGSEFARRFTTRMQFRGIAHRHSRVRTPTDNGHLERFNRTLQEECLKRIPRSLKSWSKEIPEYLYYYNNERPHMALGMKTPMEVMRSY